MRIMTARGFKAGCHERVKILSPPTPSNDDSFMALVLLAKSGCLHPGWGRLPARLARGRGRAGPAAPRPSRRPRRAFFDEGEKLGIDHVGVRRAHAMREPLVDLERALLQELRGEQRGIRDRDDLVVV